MSAPVSDSAGLGQGLRTCLSHMFPGVTAAAGSGLHFQNHWTHVIHRGCIIRFLKSKNGIEAEDRKTMNQSFREFAGHQAYRQALTAQGPHLPSSGHSQVWLGNTSLSLLLPSQVFRECRVELGKVALPLHPPNTSPNWLNE